MDNQILIAIIGILTTVSGGVIAVMKMQADTKRKDSEAQLENIKNEHAARIKELEADADMRGLLREQITLSEKQRQAQHELSEQQRKTNQEQFDNFMAALEAQRKDTDAGYRLIRNVQNDTNIQIANNSNVVRDGFSRVHSKLDIILQRLPTALNGISPKPPSEPPIPIG